MRVVFMGTPNFAVPALQKLIESKQHELTFVITQPDREVGRKKILTAPPVKELALKHGIKVFQPEKLNHDQNLIKLLKASKPDAMITVAYGQIIKEEILNIAPIINVHASLLPYYRGPAPINWCLINGDKEAGVTTMLTAKGVDTGDMLLKTSVELDDYINAVELTEKLSVLGANLLLETLDRFSEIKPEQQTDLKDPAQQYSPFMNRDLGLINFQAEELVLRSANLKQDYFVNKKINSAQNIHNLVRGLKPWPGSYFIFNEQKIQMLETDFDNSSNGKTGEVIKVDTAKKTFSIGTQKGVLVLKTLKPQSKNEMSALDWLNGQRLEIGCLL